MSGVNKVILIGNLGIDPEVRRLESGVPVARVALATSETFTDKNSGEKREITEWHNVTMWRGLAEVAEKYLHKGDKIYVEGKLKTRSWEDEKGEKRYATDIVADNMTMLGSSKGPVDSSSEGAKQETGKKPPKPESTPLDSGNEEDDLPF